MKKGIVIVIASVAMALGLQVLCASGGGPSGHSLSYDREVRPALESAVGVKSLEYQGRKFTVPTIEKTPPAGRKSPLEAGLSRAMADVLHLYIFRANALYAKALSMAPKGKGREQELLAAYRHNLLSDPIIRRALMPKVENMLREDGLTCPDLPEPHQPPSPRSVTVKELMPYALAFLWPSNIRPDGGVSLNVCIGINGLRGMKNADPLLVEAAYRCVSHNGDIMEKAEASLQKAMGTKAYDSTISSPAKLRYLRSSLAESLSTDPAFVRLLAKIASEKLPLFGLTCADCGTVRPSPKNSITKAPQTRA